MTLVANKNQLARMLALLKQHSTLDDNVDYTVTAYNSSDESISLFMTNHNSEFVVYKDGSFEEIQ